MVDIGDIIILLLPPRTDRNIEVKSEMCSVESSKLTVVTQPGRGTCFGARKG
jgi:hypothetical protein